MQERVECPSCGQAVLIESNTAVAICIHCGAQIVAPLPAQDADSLLAAVAAQSRTARPTPAPKRTSVGPILAVAACIAIAIGLVIAIILVVSRKSAPPAVADTPVSDPYPQLVAMKSKAESLALAGKLAEAHAAYDQLIRSAAQLGANDARSRDLIAAAQSDEDRIYRTLLSQNQPNSAPAERPAPYEAPLTATATAPAEPEFPSPRDSVAIAPRSSSSNSPSPRLAFPAPSRGAGSTRPAQPAAPIASAELDTRIGQAMQKAVDLILSRFNGPELGPTADPSTAYRAGLHALCVYALLQAGQSLSDDRLSIHGKLMPQLIEAAKSHSLDPRDDPIQAPLTYAHSLRAAALAVYDRPEDRKVLKADVDWLIRAQRDGAYTYDDRNPQSITAMLDIPWDNSNSQYGLLGVWAGAEVGIEVPGKYWEAVDRHWKATQQPDGQWCYAPYKPTPSLSMTCGGLASLMVTYDWLDIPKLNNVVGRDPFPGSIGVGLRWLETADHCVQTPNPQTFYIGYDLYSLERVGLASGLKFFGAHDWYRELAEKSLSYQWPSGAFGREAVDDQSVIGTAYTLLFLARGRHPVFMDKLRFDGAWANRPRDIANLTRYASRELERPMNWQVVSVDRPWHDWFDSPLLYIASHVPPKFTPDQYANLRAFVEAGGLIFTEDDADSGTFTKWVADLARQVCPDYPPQTLPTSHVLYSIFQRIRMPTKLLAVSNGSRLLIVHCPFDFARSWQLRDDKMHADRFNLGTNIFVYAAGKSDFRNRVASPFIADPPGEPTSKLRLARISYAGNWNPEPYAWKRFSRLLQTETGKSLDIQTASAEDLAPNTAPLSHLTGTASYHFTDSETSALKNYVESGGILLIDSAGGQAAFANSIQHDLLPRAFPNVRLAPIPSDHPLMANLSLRLRPYAIDQLGRSPPAIQLAQAGRGYVLFTPLDLHTGLLNTNTWGILGYTPESSEQFMRNLVTWAGQ